MTLTKTLTITSCRSGQCPQQVKRQTHYLSIKISIIRQYNNKIKRGKQAVYSKRGK